MPIFVINTGQRAARGPQQDPAAGGAERARLPAGRRRLQLSRQQVRRQRRASKLLHHTC